MTNQKKAVITIGAAIAALYFWRSKASAQPVPSVTTSEGFDLSPYGGPVVYPPALVRFAQAIARAEGFYVSGSIPQRANNPGDLKLPGWTGRTLGEGICVFDSADAGWNALYKQLYLILTGGSSVYNLDMTIDEMANSYAPGLQARAWAVNVSSSLGVDASAPLYSVLA